MCVRTPKIAVLLAAWNGTDWLAEQVGSILSQVGVEVSIFISVDSSSDGTEELANLLSEQNQNLHVLPHGLKFGGAAPNFFRLFRDVDFEGFDCVALSDQDDIWMPKKLSRAWELISNCGWDVVSSDVIAFWEDGRNKLIKKSYPKREFDHFFEAAGPGCTYVFNRTSANEFKFFLTKLGEGLRRVSLHDWLAYAFCRERGFTWHIDNHPLMLYRQHSNNQVGTNEGIVAYRKRIKMIRDGWYRKQVGLIAECVAPEKKICLLSRKFLILNFRSLRRRPRDSLFLAFLLLLRVF